MNSPKHKYMARIKYSEPLPEIGSESIAYGNSLAEVEHNAKFFTEQAKRNGVKSNVTILENKKEYPSFEWKKVIQLQA